MALGGGTFVTQNKVLAGAYINFISAARASSAVTDRGVVAMPLALDWGADGEIFEVTAEDFQKNSLKIFGYSYDHANMKGIRDLFRNIRSGYFYKLMKNGVAASNTYGTAKNKGVRGNDLKTVVVINVDDGTKVDVSTYLGATLVDSQTVLPNTDNLVDNDYVIWKANVVLAETAGLAFTLGANGDALTGTEYQAFLDLIEAYSFNALGCLSTDDTVKDLFVAFTKRLRDDMGVKFQTVIFQRESADYEGVVSVENGLIGDLTNPAAVYWVTGAIAGAAVNASNTNKLYNGEYAIDVNFTQLQLEDGIKAGMFMFHKVGDGIRVLDDINTFLTFTEEKSSDFASNQTIRVLDQIANDIGMTFNTQFLGVVPNNESGRISLWNAIVTHHQELEEIGAIEEFDSDNVTVAAGESKTSVVVNDQVTPVNAMKTLYMTVVVD